MFWAKKNIELGNYHNFLDHFNEHKPAYPKQSAEFIVSRRKDDDPNVGTFFVGVVSEDHLSVFVALGFERVAETDLPKDIDLVHFPDATADAVKRFKMRDN
jgi:hypothetical protein